MTRFSPSGSGKTPHRPHTKGNLKMHSPDRNLDRIVTAFARFPPMESECFSHLAHGRDFIGHSCLCGQLPRNSAALLDLDYFHSSTHVIIHLFTNIISDAY